MQVLQSLSATQLSRLATLLSEVSFAAGATVIRQGELSDEFYVIAEGRALVRKTPDGGGKPKLITELGPGDYFGERALLYGEPRAASVYVPADGSELKCLSVSKATFDEVPGPHSPLVAVTDRTGVTVTRSARLPVTPLVAGAGAAAGHHPSGLGVAVERVRRATGE